ncbi:Pantoate--beta-alanine ligase [Candidatus Syntrophocurvum alkaliphilum]|uniref:Pantothenate synthetase n=1 Tax=Candidatus Syntrophocurvum alkaliphilum TaxID=2293317 RepID=A0A6I6DNH3_9FIRM|nr:pantoate--beta-alanine ligase [Candidatus Syntrophocurvum alkaliphilum]QGU00508.1 Pantoate--beta-alanine ligase [Candidatus Syntrophocurvum alkaliphilum]
MEIIKTIKQMQSYSREQQRLGKTIGLVPTMGYLHEGHIELVKAARKENDIVIVSIFVNPIQFGVGEDFDIYPRDLKRDSQLLEKENVDVIFNPEGEEMYPAGYNTFVEVSGEITTKLCGASRPGHFRGVTTVVSKLFNTCLPDKAYFGQKDAQQVMVIEKMVKELNFPLTIVRVPIIREKDGLAMSSRNTYLSDELRKEALLLNQSLIKGKQAIENGEKDVEKVKKLIQDYIKTSPNANIDYVEILSGEDLSDLSDLSELKGKILIALAVKFGNTRLIDNQLVEV